MNSELVVSFCVCVNHTVVSRAVASCDYYLPRCAVLLCDVQVTLCPRSVLSFSTVDTGGYCCMHCVFTLPADTSLSSRFTVYWQ